MQQTLIRIVVALFFVSLFAPLGGVRMMEASRTKDVAGPPRKK